ncbi:MAG: hypothetical protein GX271_11685 [Clostridiales bacterium]|nr:hypothetical protein [Clostridiales bacterium]
MIDSGKSKSIRALKEAGKRNGLVYKKHNKDSKTETIKLMDENGKCFHLNKDLSIKKCDIDDNDFAVAKDVGCKRKAKVTVSKKKTSFKMQKGLQKA